jgi:predicted acetyltransferase
MFELRRPRPQDEAAFLAARALVPADNPTFLRDYVAGMAYADYLRRLENQHAGRDLPVGVAPSTFLLAFEDDRIVGRASIRHVLLPPDGPVNGHIGYAVLPPFRGRGLATRLLGAAVRYARDRFGLARVQVSCDADNFASMRVIEKNHGVFDSELDDPRWRCPKRRYWIDAAMLGAGEPTGSRR